MSKEVIAALIGAGGAIVAAIIALLKREAKRQATAPVQPSGPQVHDSPGAVIATHGSTVIQHAPAAQFDEINRNLLHIQEVLRTSLPAVPASQLENLQEVDAMIHPNNWRPLPMTRFVFPLPGGTLDDHLGDIAGKLLVRYLAYAAFQAAQGKFRRFIINLSFAESPPQGNVSIHFATNDAPVLHELKRLFERKQTQQTLEEISAALHDWDFSKKFAILRSFSLEVTIEPDQKLGSFRNAPLYEGEDADNETIVQQKVLAIDEVAARSIQASMSKVLAFLGRVHLGQALHTNFVVRYDLDGQSLYKPNFLRLVYHLLDQGVVAYDLFRISVPDPEKWDYMYQTV